MSVLDSYDPEVSSLIDEAKEALSLSIPENIRRDCEAPSQIGFLTAMVRIAAYCRDIEEFKEAIRWQIQCQRQRAEVLADQQLEWLDDMRNRRDAE
jgi:hypothetical protein